MVRAVREADEVAPGRYPGQAPIDAYGNGGFRFAGMSHRGAILCLPDAIEAWAPSSPAELEPEAFARVLDQGAAVRHLVLGTGATFVLAGPEIRRLLEAAGIALECMDTGAACRTYNILLGERRLVAAALLPVA